MAWFELRGDARINGRCATEGCGGQPTSRLETNGVGSNYCSGCKAKIEDAMWDELEKYGAGHPGIRRR